MIGVGLLRLLGENLPVQVYRRRQTALLMVRQGASQFFFPAHFILMLNRGDHKRRPARFKTEDASFDCVPITASGMMGR